MAEFGDALSTALTSQNEGLPSVFEVLAQDNLSSSIRPAIKHLFKVLAQNAPHRFGWCYAWFDELYTVVHSAVEHHFLSNHLASFAEHYYDLQRKPLFFTTPTTHFPLGRRIHLYSVIFLTVFPYLQLKVEDQYKTIKENHDFSGGRDFSRIKKIFLFCYPILQTFWNAVILYYNFMFAIGKSDYHSPLYRAIKTKLIIADPFLSGQEQTGIASFLTNFLGGGVHVGVFVLQFIEWWYDENNESSIKQVMKQPIPDPPTSVIQKSKIPVPKAGVCPLCNRLRKNDTAVMTSGYVFCYVCIYKYVKSNRCCPVTGYKTEINNLAKIYLPT
ncbi:peroxisome assembly protein 12-like [Clavelina lepadiformis]|uniref:Peroxisome assembly protein 12 n=1 Tax=Clavelina lepadiformis TaxID=159417 RepID=A0ABP0FP19_CLALP